MERTYSSWMDGAWKSAQKEYTEPTQLLGADGALLSPGWARHNVFDYDRNKVKKVMRRKEWDFYQLSNGKYMAQISFANISLGGYASAVLVDLKNGKTISTGMELFLGGKTIVLEEGDSIYFDSTKPHGMRAIGNQPVRFLAFTVE